MLAPDKLSAIPQLAATPAAGDNGPNGLAARAPALADKNREDELTNARMKSTSSKLHAAIPATGWPGLLGPAAPKHALAASDHDLDSIPVALKLFSPILPSLLLAKSKPKLAET